MPKHSSLFARETNKNFDSERMAPVAPVLSQWWGRAVWWQNPSKYKVLQGLAPVAPVAPLKMVMP